MGIYVFIWELINLLFFCLSGIFLLALQWFYSLSWVMSECTCMSRVYLGHRGLSYPSYVRYLLELIRSLDAFKSVCQFTSLYFELPCFFRPYRYTPTCPIIPSHITLPPIPHEKPINPPLPLPLHVLPSPFLLHPPVRTQSSTVKSSTLLHYFASMSPIHMKLPRLPQKIQAQQYNAKQFPLKKEIRRAGGAKKRR